jgi:hypothetical protein
MLWRMLGLALITFSALLTSAQAAEPVATNGDFSGLIDIGGGRKLYLECKGTGSPVVILEAGLRNRADIWSQMRPKPSFPKLPPSPESALMTVPAPRSASTRSAAAIR